MGTVKKTGNQGFTGAAGWYWVSDGPAPYNNDQVWDKQQRLDAMLQQLATSPYYYTSNAAPLATWDSTDTADVGRPFRTGAIVVNKKAQSWVCTGHAAGAATWLLLTAVGEASTSSSESSSSSESTSSTEALTTSSSTTASSESSSESSASSSSSASSASSESSSSAWSSQSSWSSEGE